MFAIILYWIHWSAFEAEYITKIASTSHRRLYILNSPGCRAGLSNMLFDPLTGGFIRSEDLLPGMYASATTVTSGTLECFRSIVWMSACGSYQLSRTEESFWRSFIRVWPKKSASVWASCFLLCANERCLLVEWRSKGLFLLLVFFT